jgi:hypothetical protein
LDPAINFLMRHFLFRARRISVRRAHTSDASFSGKYEASTQDQRLILMLIEAFLPE